MQEEKTSSVLSPKDEALRKSLSEPNLASSNRPSASSSANESPLQRENRETHETYMRHCSKKPSHDQSSFDADAVSVSELGDYENILQDTDSSTTSNSPGKSVNGTERVSRFGLSAEEASALRFDLESSEKELCGKLDRFGFIVVSSEVTASSLQTASNGHSRSIKAQMAFARTAIVTEDGLLGPQEAAKEEQRRKERDASRAMKWVEMLFVLMTQPVSRWPSTHRKVFSKQKLLPFLFEVDIVFV